MNWYWISARYQGRCSLCERKIFQGESMLYWPDEGKPANVFCKECGTEAVRELEDPEVEL